MRRILSPCIVSYAAGTLLGAAFLGMIPHALEYNRPRSILSSVLAGIIIFFLLEKLVIWRHCHIEGCEIHNSAGTLILIGDVFPNFLLLRVYPVDRWKMCEL